MCAVEPLNSEVLHALKNLDPSKACGPDNIPGRLLKGQWQQNFLLSILKVLLHLTMNMILIPCQTFLFRSYMHVISLLIYISSAILARIPDK
jgi:hypothetical protein